MNKKFQFPTLYLEAENLFELVLESVDLTFQSNYIQKAFS